jgi:hypothetical protein
MHPTDSEHSSDNSGSDDDTRQSGSVPNSLLQLQDAYETGSDSVVSCTPENKFEEHDGLSNCSDLHTPAQPSKRLRLPSVSPVKRRQVVVSDSEFDGVERDSLFDPASVVSSARGCLGRLLRNGTLRKTIGRLCSKKSG